MHKTGLYIFSNDLRVENNAALLQAATVCKELVCVFIAEPIWFKPGRYGTKPLGDHRWRFLYESLLDLESALEQRSQQLHVVFDHFSDAVSTLITQYDVDSVFRSEHAGYYENKQWALLKNRYPLIAFQETATHTIFSRDTLPCTLSELPLTFSKFRRLVEPLPLEFDSTEPMHLPPPPSEKPITNLAAPAVALTADQATFRGGSKEAKKHLKHYFAGHFASNYKTVRNELEGWSNSTKFSPWLANGSLSVHEILTELTHYESSFGANESTLWIRFELFWREYFQWLSHAFGSHMFKQEGIKNTKVLSSYYPERFQRWCAGNTPYPLVNACMKQLNATGYMSNRGRQIVASCFVNELDLDWRYGAAYFEQQLVDYDVAANWGNWQYLAGVGVDPRGKRHFDLEKQAAIYDPKSEFTLAWQGQIHSFPLDSVDAADWPVRQIH